MNQDKIKLIVTLGPATKTENDLRKIKDKGADFVRINMSHSSLDDLEYYIALSKKVGIPFIIDTEGSQIRTGDMLEKSVNLEENTSVKIHKEKIIGDKDNINLRPSHIINQLEEGDLIYIDFEALILRVSNITTIKEGYITASAVTSGTLASNKAVVIDSALNKTYSLPPLSEKDLQSVKVGLRENIKYIAASFMRSGEFVDEVRRITQNSMKIISKVECLDALKNIDKIIEKSDYILLDRGDLSKEISLEKLPLVQKIILSKARKNKKDVFVATNLLETMVYNRRPTRAEIHDVISTIMDGAFGLTLSSETAIGKYPMESINMLNKLIKQAQLVKNSSDYLKIDDNLTKQLQDENYLLDTDIASPLIKPHGGKLINRFVDKKLEDSYLNSLEKIKLDENLQMDVEQIAVGTFSPLEGFMDEKDFKGVLNNMRLGSGVVWTIPIILDVSQEQAEKIKKNQEVALEGDDGIMALMKVSDKYSIDKNETVKKLYDTDNIEHPGVRWINSLKPVLLGGQIDLIKRRKSEYKEYELTPAQVRKIFEERGWVKIVGFHTRNVIHNSHEFIQLKAMSDENCDGLFVHPVIGKKKPGDYNTKFIIESYEEMKKNYYPGDRVVMATFSTFSRYAGPREAIFTALCRKNFGCSHFVVGRDHTGVGNFYHPKASHKIFDRFPDLGIKPVRFDNVFYSKKLKQYIHELESPNHEEEDKMHISGTQARKMFEQGECPPDWFMRPAISKFILDLYKQGEEIFVTENKTGLVVWFTGLSSSGKTTIALNLKEKLTLLGKTIAIIDGDEIRNNQHKHLGFSREDIRENNRLIAEFARDKAKEHDLVLVPIISPYQKDRQLARTIVGENFYELFINLPLEKCIARDVKGFFKKALAGEIKDFIGVSESNPYEAPTNPDLEIKTDELTIEEAVEKIISIINEKI